MQVQSLCWEDPLEEEITYSWIIPWTEEPWWATVPGVTKSWTRLKQLNTAQHSTTPFRMPPSGSVAKNLPANAGDVGPNPGSGRSPGGRNSNRTQYSCLENPTDRRVWWAVVHGVTRSETQWAHPQQSTGMMKPVWRMVKLNLGKGHIQVLCAILQTPCGFLHCFR